MDLERTSVTVRQRTRREALDLGIIMGRRWWRTSVIGAAMIAGPLFLIVNSLAWTAPALAAIVIWWVKPLYERVPVAVIGRGFFGEQRPALRLLREIDWSPGAIFLDLTWRRFSPYRSFFAPVGQLESLSARARLARVGVLGRGQHSTAAGIASFGVVVEMSLYFGIYAFLNVMVPQGLDWEVGLPDYAQAGWAPVLSNALIFAIQLTVMPFYVGMGFSLYIKRRIDIEAWDLDLAFRRLRRRLSGNAPSGRRRELESERAGAA